MYKTYPISTFLSESVLYQNYPLASFQWAPATAHGMDILTEIYEGHQANSAVDFNFLFGNDANSRSRIQSESHFLMWAFFLLGKRTQDKRRRITDTFLDCFLQFTQIMSDVIFKMQISLWFKAICEKNTPRTYQYYRPFTNLENA